MDTRIDVQGQYALFRMLKGRPAHRVDGSHILSAVKAGSLAGVYQEDQQAPAMRAQALGTWWGEILPKGEDGTCVTAPPSKPPIVVMRRGTPADKARYDEALALAWAQCQVPAPWPVRPYDPSAPGDPPATGAPQECHGAQQMARALQECEDSKNRRVQACEVAGGLQQDTIHPPARLFDVQGCIGRASEAHAACQQVAYAACR